MPPLTNTHQPTGLLIKAHSGFFTVREASGAVTVCKAAGRLTKGKHEEDALAVGDHVTFEHVPSEGLATGRIIAVEKRGRSLSRKDPIASIKDNREIRQVIVANLDLVVFVFACAEPDFHARMLDRYLVGAEAQALPVLIVASKIDLVGPDAAHALFALYERIGYEVLYVSASAGDGMDALRDRLHGKVSVFTGKSGVGKSSLLNALKPGLEQEVGRISAAIQKGKHTTVVPELIALDDASWIADTPGIRGYAIWDVPAEVLDEHFREIRPLIGQCTFRDCTHVQEKGCAVLAAVARGEISPERYDSYARLREELSRQRRY
jgi:ribosome biogenesis GTPase / thiamine phosphate phosphatase